MSEFWWYLNNAGLLLSFWTAQWNSWMAHIYMCVCVLLSVVATGSSSIKWFASWHTVAMQIFADQWTRRHFKDKKEASVVHSCCNNVAKWCLFKIENCSILNEWLHFLHCPCRCPILPAFSRTEDSILKALPWLHIEICFPWRVK